VKLAGRNIPKQISIEMVPGNHHTCITRQTSALAARMRATLDGVEKASQK
jgi:DNA polymerase II small subunit/DNA polymerase delta subunit B